MSTRDNSDIVHPAWDLFSDGRTPNKSSAMKCTKCGRSTYRYYLGKPTCSYCERELKGTK